MGKFFKTAMHRMGVGSMVKDVNPTCPHHGAKGKVLKSYPHKVTFIVINKGSKYKPGDVLTKTIDQMEKVANVPFKSNKLMENAVTSRVALEGTQDKKTMDNLNYYNKIKNSRFAPQPLVSLAEDKIIEKNKKKHGKFIYKTFGNVPDKKYKELVMTSLGKMNKGHAAMKDMHKADSLALVNSGQKYPEAVDDYFKELKHKKALKEQFADNMQKESAEAMKIPGLPEQPYDAATNVPVPQNPLGKGGMDPKTNRPYAPKMQSLPSLNKFPKIRPIQPLEKDLITTRADSILSKVNKPIPGVN